MSKGLELSEKSDQLGNAVPEGTDLVEWYYEQGFSDGLPVVPPTPEKLAAMIEALGGDPDQQECRVPPRWGNLTREVLAINCVMAGCLPAYAPVVRAAMLALTDTSFNLNGVQATTHMVAPLLVVNGPIRGEIDMNAGCNVFGSGNRANATIGRAISTRAPWVTPANTAFASPRTRTRARGRRITWSRATGPRTAPSSALRPRDRTASLTTWRTTRKGCSTASSRR